MQITLTGITYSGNTSSFNVFWRIKKNAGNEDPWTPHPNNPLGGFPVIFNTTSNLPGTVYEVKVVILDGTCSPERVKEITEPGVIMPPQPTKLFISDYFGQTVLQPNAGNISHIDNLQIENPQLGYTATNHTKRPNEPFARAGTSFFGIAAPVSVSNYIKVEEKNANGEYFIVTDQGGPGKEQNRSFPFETEIAWKHDLISIDGIPYRLVWRKHDSAPISGTINYRITLIN